MGTRFAVFDLGDKEDKSAPPKSIFDAAERGNTGYIVKVVERTVEFDVNQKDQLQRTALHWAAEMGHVKTAEALLDFGVDVAAAECNGRTALHLAARAGHAEMLKTLVENLTLAEKEKLINQPDNFGITSVFLALQKGEEGRAAFEFLMANGGRYSDKNK